MEDRAPQIPGDPRSVSAIDMRENNERFGGSLGQAAPLSAARAAEDPAGRQRPVQGPAPPLDTRASGVTNPSVGNRQERMPGSFHGEPGTGTGTQRTGNLCDGTGALRNGSDAGHRTGDLRTGNSSPWPMPDHPLPAAGGFEESRNLSTGDSGARLQCGTRMNLFNAQPPNYYSADNHASFVPLGTVMSNGRQYDGCGNGDAQSDCDDQRSLPSLPQFGEPSSGYQGEYPQGGMAGSRNAVFLPMNGWSDQQGQMPNGMVQINGQPFRIGYIQPGANFVMGQSPSINMARPHDGSLSGNQVQHVQMPVAGPHGDGRYANMTSQGEGQTEGNRWDAQMHAVESLTTHVLAITSGMLAIKEVIEASAKSNGTAIPSQSTQTDDGGQPAKTSNPPTGERSYRAADGREILGNSLRSVLRNGGHNDASRTGTDAHNDAPRTGTDAHYDAPRTGTDAYYDAPRTGANAHNDVPRTGTGAPGFRDQRQGYSNSAACDTDAGAGVRDRDPRPRGKENVKPRVTLPADDFSSDVPPRNAFRSGHIYRNPPSNRDDQYSSQSSSPRTPSSDWTDEDSPSGSSGDGASGGSSSTSRLGRLTRPVMMPSKYDKSTPFEHFRNLFEDVAGMNGWDEQDMARCLPQALPLDVYENISHIPTYSRGAYRAMIHTLTRRYGASVNLERNQALFQARTQKNEEDFETFAQALTTLAGWAYPDLDYYHRQLMIKRQYFAGLRDRTLAMWVGGFEPHTVQEAVTKSMALSTIYEKRAAKPSRARHVNDDREVIPWIGQLGAASPKAGDGSKPKARRPAKDNKPFPRQPAKTEARKAPVTPPRGERTGQADKKNNCFNCGRPGHFARDCPEEFKPKTAPRKTSGKTPAPRRREGNEDRPDSPSAHAGGSGETSQ